MSFVFRTAYELDSEVWSPKTNDDFSLALHCNNITDPMQCLTPTMDK